MTAPVVYIDASALAKIFLAETQSAELLDFLDCELTLTSNLIARVEVWRALRRTGASDELLARARAFLERVNFRRLSDEILVRAAEVTPRPLRTLDALHLATALDLSPPPDLFLCYDRRLGDAASAHGLAVVSPGTDEVHLP